MKSLAITAAKMLALGGWATAAASNSWMGTSLYFLHGMSDSAQNAYIDALVLDRVKVARLWVNAQSKGCQKGTLNEVDLPALETTLGEYNDETLDALDKTILKLSERGIKALISPHDANSLLGDYRSDIYYDTYGAGYFYETQEAFEDYDARLTHILNYQGTYSGKVWKEWPEATMGFDLQNEPMTAKVEECTNGDIYSWTCGRAQHMRKELGADNPIIIASGGLGGDFSHGCTFMASAIECDALDAIAVHRYASVPGHWSSSIDDWVSQANGKLVFLEEWGINTTKYDAGSAFASELSDMNSVGLPGIYWQILPTMQESCSYDPSADEGDPFGVYIDSGVDLASPMTDATNSPAYQDWTGIIY